MENRTENTDGAEIPKKSRSLDLKSLYKSKVSVESQRNKDVKRKTSLEDDGDEQRKKRKKNSKTVSLSRYRSVDNSKKSVTEVYDSGVKFNLHDAEDSKLGLGQKRDNGTAHNGISLSLNDGGIHVPRRKRGLVGRKKGEASQISKPSGQSSGEVGHAEQVARATDDASAIQVESQEFKPKKVLNDCKENINGGPNSVRSVEEEGGNANHSTINNDDSSLKKENWKQSSSKRKLKENGRAKPLVVEKGDSSSKKLDGISSSNKSRHLNEDDVHPRPSVGNTSLKKSKKNHSKRKESKKDSKRVAKGAVAEVEAVGDTSAKVRHDLLEDEENLEENAAMMLSSRFDPSCTGFSSSKPVASRKGSLSSPSGDDSGSRGSKSPLLDPSGRALRPRMQHNEKGPSSKRRRYYEVLFGDLDAYWVLNCRIKVFWPLDKCWYYGLVNEYDSERKLHHVKYDDRDEEWINLENERFKLLLLPSEVPGRAARRRSRVREKCSNENKASLEDSKEKGKRTLSSIDDNSNSHLDSEPIISWLARTRVKSSPFPALKKQKKSNLSPDSGAVDSHGCSDGRSLEKNINQLLSKSVLPESSTYCGGDKVSILETPSYSRYSNPPIVYYRRCFHKGGNNLHPTKSVLHETMLRTGNVRSTGTLTDSRQFRLAFSFPVRSVLDYAFGAESLWLFRAVLLFHHGVLMTTWPTVHLEMLFVDNLVGLRFLLFEGSLKQAVAYASLILKVFRKPYRHIKYDLQLPVTSIRFKFSSNQGLKKQCVFAFYNFSKVNNSLWMYLDSKLKDRCLLATQLPLAECTYDNIKVLKKGSNQLFTTSSVCRDSSPTQGLLRRQRQGINHMGAFRESNCLKVGQFSSYSHEKQKNFPAFALSFTAAPTFFLSLHLKLLMEHSVNHINFWDHDSSECSESCGRLLVDDCSSSECSPSKGRGSPYKNNVQESAPKSYGKHTDYSDCSYANLIHSSQKYENGTSACSRNQNGSKANFALAKWRCHDSELEQGFVSPRPSVDSDKTDSGSPLNGIRVEIPSFDPYEKHIDRECQSAPRRTDLTRNMNGGVIPSPNPTARRSTWHRNRSGSSSFGSHAHGWSEAKADIVHNNFGSGPKKPRTQVSYSLPYGGFDDGSKNRSSHQKGLPHTRIRRANEKKLSDVIRGPQKNLELSSCDANVLVTHGDKGWRECGAQVVLEIFDHNEWKLAVKLSGTTRFSYKAHQFLQPGSTNRYTHAMMWKGGKDWTLEFPNRSQWALFKELHEECYNRNFRAASVKNIPIPGVRLIEEPDYNVTEVAFVRSSSKYFRQVETDVEMALNPSRILYDMDSDDERWVENVSNSSEAEKSGLWEIYDHMFEKIIDMFEKAAFSQKRDHFTSDEIEELMAGVGPMEAIKAIHDHWRQKRLKKGMPLIRHLQPPLWESYQQQVREWEQAMSKINATLSNGCQEKVATIEKPPMFAFCLKPRGLELPNRGSKHRSHRRISVSGKNSTSLVDHDGFNSYGRRLNGFAFGEEKVVYPGHYYEPLDESPISQPSPRLFSPRVFSPRDAGNSSYFSMSNDGFDRNQYQNLQRIKSKRYGMHESLYEPPMTAPYNQRPTSTRNGTHRWIMGFPERHLYADGSHRHHGPDQLDASDLDEFRLRDASGAAQHARNMARLKRERAQKLLYKADLAVHKAVAALMTAEAMKASVNNVNSDG